jgi:hypothetical protein
MTCCGAKMQVVRSFEWKGSRWREQRCRVCGARCYTREEAGRVSSAYRAARAGLRKHAK